MIKIISPGLLSTIQDMGRYGAMKDGFTQCGAADSRSMSIANKLCGNDINTPVIEMTLLGITAIFDCDSIIAVSGATFDMKLGSEEIRTNKTYAVKAGDTLTIGGAKKGLRGYLAVKGGFYVKPFMGSVSTDIKSAVGGVNGRKLQAGDEIETDSCNLSSIVIKELPENDYQDSIIIRCVKGPQDSMFTKEDFEMFFSSNYTVDPKSDRMGMRLEGPSLKGKNGMDIISDGIVFGSIQVPKNGQPIILLADHQTTGGYAKIATVIRTDLPLLAQAKPGSTIRFKEISVREAEKLSIKEKKTIDKI